MTDETVYIVLFRGVGGATQLPTKELREALTKAGFRKAGTYINSGNAVVVSSLSAAGTVEKIAQVTKKAFGFDKSILVRDPDQWAAVIEDNPFPRAVEKPTTLHVFALEKEPAPAAVEALAEKATGTERFVVDGTTLYLHAPDGLGRSKFAPKIETTLKVPMTARNWNTVLALMKMAEERQA